MPRKVLSRRTTTSSMADEPQEIEVPAAPQTDAPASAKMTPFAIAVLVVVLIAAGGLLVKNTLAAKKTVEKPAISDSAVPAEDDVQGIIRRVAKHIKIKSDEVPTVATVQDPELLRKNNPSFYQYAQSGDRLLIWSDKAILYSPSEDILLAVMPVTLNQADTKTQPSADQSPSKEQAVIEIRNGSGVTGLGKTLATKLKELKLEVLPPGDAKSKAGYPKTILMVKPGKDIPNTVKGLQELTGAQIVTVLPEDEPGLKGDILIILGSDKK